MYTSRRRQNPHKDYLCLISSCPVNRIISLIEVKITAAYIYINFGPWPVVQNLCLWSHIISTTRNMMRYDVVSIEPLRVSSIPSAFKSEFLPSGKPKKDICSDACIANFFKRVLLPLDFIGSQLSNAN